MPRVDPEELRRMLAEHVLQVDYNYEEQECACGYWKDDGMPGDDPSSYADHLVEVASRPMVTGSGKQF